jgi:hypothetical protein
MAPIQSGWPAVSLGRFEARQVGKLRRITERLEKTLCTRLVAKLEQREIVVTLGDPHPLVELEIFDHAPAGRGQTNERPGPLLQVLK